MKRLNTIIGILIITSVMTGCNSRITQPLTPPEFTATDLGSAKANNVKQDISIKMDAFYPAPLQGMKWTYNLSRVYDSTAANRDIDISIESVNNKYVYVEVSGQTMRFERNGFWYDFNLYLTRVFHNKDFAEFPGTGIDDQYSIDRICETPDPDSCGGYKVEIPLGKFIVEKIMFQEIGSTSDDPNFDHNILNWSSSHYWVNDKVGLIEMKLQTLNHTDLGTTTLTLVRTNIRK
jgi:hypothetical protein